MAVAPQSGPVSAAQFLEQELRELGEKHPSFLTIKLAAGISAAQTSPHRMQNDLANATSGHLDIVQKYMDKLAARHFKITHTPSPDDKTPHTPVYPGLKLLESQIVRKYEVMLIAERLSAAGPIFDKYANAVVVKMETIRPVDDNHLVKPVPAGREAHDHRWVDTHPDDEIIVAQEVDSVSHIRTPSPVAAPVLATARPADSAIKVVLSEVVGTPATAQPAKPVSTKPAAAALGNLPVLTEVLLPKNTAPAAAIVEEESGFSAKSLLAARAIFERDLAKKSGAELKDYIVETLMPARRSIITEIQGRNGKASEDMLNHAVFLDRTIMSAKERLAATVIPTPTKVDVAAAAAVTAAAAPVTQLFAQPEPFWKRALSIVKDFVADLFNPLKPVDDYLAARPIPKVQPAQSGLEAALAANPGIRAAVERELAAASPRTRASLNPSPLARLSNWFKDAADTGVAFGKALSAEIQTRSPGRHTAIGAGALASVALAGTLAFNMAGQNAPDTERVASNGPAVTNAVTGKITQAAPASLPAASSESTTLAAAPITTAAPAAAILSAPEPAPTKEVTRTFTRKSFNIEPAPQPQQVKPTTITFTDGSTYVSQSDAKTWTRLCEQGFDICKNIKSLTPQG